MVRVSWLIKHVKWFYFVTFALSIVYHLLVVVFGSLHL